MLLAIILWIVAGLAVAFAASKLVNLKGDDPRIGIALGAVAAVVGGAVYSVIAGRDGAGFDPWSLLFAALAAGAASVVWFVVRGRAAPVLYQNRRYR